MAKNTSQPQRRRRISGGVLDRSFASTADEVSEIPAKKPRKKVAAQKKKPAKRKQQPESKQDPPKRRPPRKDINLDDDTHQMLLELIPFAQRQSGQAVTASEIVRGLIQELYKAHTKKAWAPSGLPQRGKWGTPSVKEFQLALGVSAGEGIANGYSSKTLNQPVNESKLEIDTESQMNKHSVDAPA